MENLKWKPTAQEKYNYFMAFLKSISDMYVPSFNRESDSYCKYSLKVENM